MIGHPDAAPDSGPQDAAPYLDGRPDNAELDLDHAAIHHLKRTGWTIAQIAACVGRDRATVTQVLRAGSGSPTRRPTGVGAAPPLTIRLSRDACRLQIVLPADGLPAPTALLLAQIQAHCAGRHIALAVTAEDLERRLRTCVYGAWLTIAEATRPTPPRPERVRVLVPVPLAGRRRDEAGPRAAVLVRRGTVLACREAGTPGQPGRDLLGRALPPRQPRPARLPQGQNTVLSADGRQLRAACDGRVLLRHLRLHVLPATIHEGDLTAADGVLRADGDVIVTGSVRDHGAIEAQGDVEIQGAVHLGRVSSATGAIAVAGAVVGMAAQPSVLRAGGDVTCARVLHASLEAGGSIRVQADVRHSRLAAAGHLYLSAALERCVFDAHLSIGGGVAVPVAPVALAADAPTERQHTRVPLRLAAHIAVHAVTGVPPPTFTPCVIEDLSPGGARCRLSAPLVSGTPPQEGVPDTPTILQLKFVVPESGEQVIAIARLVRVGAANTIGIAFLQITERDADRLMQFCVQQLRAHTDLRLGTRADRRT